MVNPGLAPYLKRVPELYPPECQNLSAEELLEKLTLKDNRELMEFYIRCKNGEIVLDKNNPKHIAVIKKFKEKIEHYRASANVNLKAQVYYLSYTRMLQYLTVNMR